MAVSARPDFAFGGRALVLDPNPTSRSILASQLRDWGLAQVQTCSGVRDARRLLETLDFDVVLCEMDFPTGSPSGSELLEDLRRDNLLPLDTTFVMVSGEARYARVAEAAESALDSYLLKPFTALSLFERLQQSRQRKQALREIFQAVEAQDHALAARLCLARVQAKGSHWLYAARLGAELLLRLGDHAGARKLLDQVLAHQALPWARLGIARTQIEAQQGAQALRTLNELVADEPGFADAYDVMGRVQVDLGQVGEALETYRRAVELTPGSVTRQQKLGLLAFYAGDLKEAAHALGRAAVMGLSSRSFDAQSLVLMGLCHARAGDTKGLRRVAHDLARLHERQPEDRRLSRFASVIDVAQRLQDRQVGAALQGLEALAAQIDEPDFDFEAACNLLSLLGPLAASEVQLERAPEWVDRMAMRFCTAAAYTELLTRAARPCEAHAELIQQRSRQIVGLLERAMTYSLKGQAEAAIRALLKQGESTRNPRFVEAAHGVLQRHGAKLGDASRYTEAVQAFRSRWGGVARTPPLGRTGAHVGGLSLRGDRSAPTHPDPSEPAPAAPARPVASATLSLPA